MSSTQPCFRICILQKKEWCEKLTNQLQDTVLISFLMYCTFGVMLIASLLSVCTALYVLMFCCLLLDGLYVPRSGTMKQSRSDLQIC